MANRLGIQWMKAELEDLAFKYLEREDYVDLEERMQSTEAGAPGVHRPDLARSCAR